VVQTAAPRTARRLEILRRAADVFRRRGYHDAGMREIADGLGLRPGALYYYFRSKEDLLYACQEETLRRLVEGARRIARSPEPASDRLRALIAFHLDLTLTELGGSAAHVEFRALPPARLREVVRRRDAYEMLVRRILRDGAADGTLRDVDPRVGAWMLLGALNWTVVWWRPDGRLGAADLAREFADLCLGGLEAREMRR
jgi:TetR/AcrR family transcriptional regulator, cholesterol catabolism regulator